MPDSLPGRLRNILGEKNVVARDAVPPSPWDTQQPFRGRYMMLPESVQQVAAVLDACNRAGQAVVPVGGQTNLVQACATRESDLGLSLARMNAIEEVDPIAQTMTVQAGVTLAAAQQSANAENMLFPVDIGSRDNCTLGGNAATNAGGTRVIRYGMMRDSILGLEAVLADGTVLSSMNRYLKNNSGFDLKHLFIGTEGTLGVITRLVFRLREAPASHNVALVGVSSYADVVAVLSDARSKLSGSLCGFEVMWQSFYAKATRPAGPQPSPLDATLPYYIIVEAMGSNSAEDDRSFEAVFEALAANGRIADGTIAKSGREREAIWAIRHEVEWLVSGAQNFDVSLRIADVEKYLSDLAERIERQYPDAYLAAFGHLGDNNIHISIIADGSASRPFIEEQVYSALRPYAGAISAEHGIGLEKREFLPVSRSREEIGLMVGLKKTLDPHNILNPGKVVDAATDQALGEASGH